MVNPGRLERVDVAAVLSAVFNVQQACSTVGRVYYPDLGRADNAASEAHGALSFLSSTIDRNAISGASVDSTMHDSTATSG